MSNTNNYHPEPYWSEVAERIDSRGENNVLAGDDSPFYRYKRQQFLKLFNSVDFTEKDVLEIGCGPGGNLIELNKHNPANIYAADISENMIKLAKANIGSIPVSFHKTNGTTLPFADQSIDIVFSVTVLQHNSDEDMMKALLREMCRVSRDKVILFERVESTLKGDELCVGRPVEYYNAICEQEGFEIKDVQFINIQSSYLVSGAAGKLFSPKNRKEGQKLSTVSELLQSATLPLTKVLDKVFKVERDLAKLEFKRK